MSETVSREPLSEPALARLLAAARDAEAAPEPPPLLPARYRIVRELGRGGMGIVWLARDEQLGRDVALKVLHAGAEPALRDRLLREALAAAQLRHGHIAAIHDATPDYISMQFVDGGPIDAIPRCEQRRLVALVRDAARAVQHAHEHGIVHRDLKPSNLLVEGERVFVVDFGLAKSFANGGDLSLPGTLLGTPAFMPPEQALGRRDVDARSDVYALGATLYHCLVGSPPFQGDDLPTLLRRIVDDEPPHTAVDRDLDRVLQKCLQKDRSDRYQSAADLAFDLQRWLDDLPVQAVPPSLFTRARKLLRRRRALVRSAGIAALLTALVLGPIALRESAARAAAAAAVELSEDAAVAMQDAAIYRRLGDLPSAHRALEASIAEVRAFAALHEVPRVRLVLSRLLRERGRPDEARAELDRALAVDPDLAAARFERGIATAAQPLDANARQAAIADLRTPLPPNTGVGDVERLFGAAELQRLLGEYARAIAMLQEVLAYDPTHVPARRSLSLCALDLGDDELGRHYAVSASDLQMGYGPAYLELERRGMPTAILGLDAVLVDYSSSWADGTDTAMALAHRGLVQLRRAMRLWAAGDNEGALRAAQGAVEDHDATLTMHPDLPGALNNRAVCAMQVAKLAAGLGDAAAAAAARGRAAADLEQALARAPELREARVNRAELALADAELLLHLAQPDARRRALASAAADFTRALDGAAADWIHGDRCRRGLATAKAALGD